MKILKAAGLIIGGVAIVLGVFILYIAATDYRPPMVTELEIEDNRDAVLAKDQPFSVTTFNIGYCGLDRGQDFFMDGGVSSRSSSKQQTMANLEQVIEFLNRESPDFILLQEVDINSSRSYGIDQYKRLSSEMGEYGRSFAVNYRVGWVPVPLTRPMGYVNSGICMFSRYNARSYTRYQFPGKDSWIRQLFLLDRCMIEARIPVDNGKELILANLHLSAYDKGGKVREQQIKFLKEYIESSYQNGNYMIIGGDWNHLLARNRSEISKHDEDWPAWLVKLPEDFIPEGFEWAVDDTVYTVRDNRTAYIPGETFTTIIDGFLVSTNIEIVEVQGHDLGFESSDHNPVSAIFRLK